MDRRGGSQTSFSAKSKSVLSSATSLTYTKQEKSSKTKLAAPPETNRHFRFNLGPNNAKKVYIKNSDKTIKPPQNGRKTTVKADEQSLAFDCSSVLNNFRNTLEYTESTIDDLERRVENLQSLLMKQAELLKSRDAENVGKEYKFVALIIGKEAKLLVKEEDAKHFPTYLPAKSMEDLRRKARDFFIACLLSFMDKLRCYQANGSLVNCEEIYKDLKNRESEYCSIFQNWIRDFCGDEEKALMELEYEEVELEMQTEIVEKENRVMFTEREVQTESGHTDDLIAKNSALTTKLNMLRLENYEFKDQLAEEKQLHVGEIETLERKYNDKISHLIDSWQKEKKARQLNEDLLKRAQEENIDLSQQAVDLRKQLNELMEKNGVLLSQKVQNDKNQMELEKCTVEIERIQNENKELQDVKSQLIKKLSQRNAKIELQEKEISLLKRVMQTTTEELLNLQKLYDSKAKEVCDIKETLESRNKLIEHLRNAVDVEQRRIREYEIALKSSKSIGLENKTEKTVLKYSLLRDIRSKTSVGGYNLTKTGLGFCNGSKLFSYNTSFKSDILSAFESKLKEEQEESDDIASKQRTVDELDDKPSEDEFLAEI